MASFDIRQIVAGMLTVSMFIMLGNMIRKDYIDPPIVDDLSSANGDYKTVSKQSVYNVSSPNSGPWKANIETVKPCWDMKDERMSNQPKRNIIFSLSGGPHRHLLQISSAVLIARQLKATLALPVIFGNKAGERREFGEVYDVHQFLTSLDGIVKIVYHQPLSTNKLPTARIPDVVSEDYVTTKIEPLFRREGNLKLVTDFATSNVTNVEGMKYMKLVSCTVVFEALHWQPALQELVKLVLEKIKTMNPQSDGRFIAVDWRSEILGMKRCQGTTANGRNSCFTVEKIGQFLKKIGFEKNTTIYLTQNGWHHSLDQLTNIYPYTYTKERLIPRDMVANYCEFTTEIDFHLCSQSDVFVPVFSQMFYAGVVGERIALGKTHILDPAQATSSNDTDYESPYISKKSHWAYSCFC